MIENYPKVVVKTKAKTVRGKLEAIINQHFVCNYPTSGDVSILTKDAVTCILKEFKVELKI